MNAEWMKKHGLKLGVAILVVLAAIAAYFIYRVVFDDNRFPDVQPAASFSLTNLDGSEVTLENTNGKVRLMYFYFSHCPDVCPPTTHVLSQVQEELKAKGVFGSKALLMSITFDPARDTTERLKEYSGKFNADYDGWYFLRGEEAYSREVALQYGVNVLPMDDGTFVHQNLYVLVDKNGNIRHYYLVGNNLDSIDPAKIADDMVYLTRE